MSGKWPEAPGGLREGKEKKSESMLFGPRFVLVSLPGWQKELVILLPEPSAGNSAFLLPAESPRATGLCPRAGDTKGMESEL